MVKQRETVIGRGGWGGGAILYDSREDRYMGFRTHLSN